MKVNEERVRSIANRVPQPVGARLVDWYLRRAGRFMAFPPYALHVQREVERSQDSVRRSCVALALERIDQDSVPGAIAELGVYRGDLSRFINLLAYGRTFYLFDTFKGFPERDTDAADSRFGDTSLELVLDAVGHAPNIAIRSGYFPDTAIGLEGERFAFVMLDADLYAPTRAGLEFFYPRLSPGGYLFLHDYNSPESNRAVSRAANEFLEDKPESLIEMPDRFGSAVLRRTQ